MYVKGDLLENLCTPSRKDAVVADDANRLTCYGAHHMVPSKNQGAQLRKTYVCAHMFVYIHMYICTCVYIYIGRDRERERDRERQREISAGLQVTVQFVLDFRILQFFPGTESPENFCNAPACNNLA